MPIITRFLILVIRSYQLVVSPLTGVNCRFAPSCSRYAIEAITIHGACRGILLTCGRLLRCHPFSECGCDPVPPAKSADINSPTKA